MTMFQTKEHVPVELSGFTVGQDFHESNSKYTSDSLPCKVTRKVQKSNSCSS